MRGFHVKLSDGTFYTENDISWLKLRELLKDKNLKIVQLCFNYDNNTLYFPNHAKHYFYIKRASAWLDIDLPQILEYGIGATNPKDDSFLEVTWFDGENSYIESRKINPMDLGLIMNV